ncbi:serine protease [Lysinibacillus contaminans]|uniref:Serine protease n=1 Tax=Lysinibacillus contaminans TaxID=1293441 RepID=A0ABR5JX94_9BACI|nr:subtilosin A family bacteriocin [Lysinibacillus contaminans]KOS66795.1 serine protease [Lysinibacillus contaminans]
MEKGLVVANKGCSACSIGAICLITGPVPDFEVASISGIFSVWG